MTLTNTKFFCDLMVSAVAATIILVTATRMFVTAARILVTTAGILVMIARILVMTIAVILVTATPLTAIIIPLTAEEATDYLRQERYNWVKRAFRHGRLLIFIHHSFIWVIIRSFHYDRWGIRIARTEIYAKAPRHSGRNRNQTQKAR
jgi:hypothetical protein